MAPPHARKGWFMAELIVVAYDRDVDAEGAYRTIQGLQDDLVVELAGLALVHVDKAGRTHVETPARAQQVTAAAAIGALFGTLIGLLLFVPAVGFVAGGALGALVAALNGTAVDAQFRARAREEIEHGESALIVYATKVTADKFGQALAPFGGTLIQTSLSEADEHLLARDLTSVK